MHYGRIINDDIANGPGVRVSLFVSGCRNHCKGCFQPETWNFDYGEIFTEATVNEIIQMLKPKHIQGLTILGGDPFEPENRNPVAYLLEEVYEEFGGEKDIWVFTGYLFEDLWKEESAKEILKNTDVLVDGPFIEDLAQLGLTFRGSTNQRIIDIGATILGKRKVLEPVLWKHGEYN